MSYIDVSGYIRIRAISRGTWNKWNLGYFGLMAVLDPIGYGNELKDGYFWIGEGSEKPPHDQAPVF